MEELIKLEQVLVEAVEFVPPDESVAHFSIHETWDGDLNISEAAEVCRVQIPDLLDAIREFGLFFEGNPGVVLELNEEARDFTEMGDEMGESRRKTRINKLCGALIIRKAALMAWGRSQAGHKFLVQRWEARRTAA